jgi:hypothetical protein
MAPPPPVRPKRTKEKEKEDDLYSDNVMSKNAKNSYILPDRLTEYPFNDRRLVQILYFGINYISSRHL